MVGDLVNRTLDSQVFTAAQKDEGALCDKLAHQF
jgi:hypothetical protein